MSDNNNKGTHLYR